MKAYHTRSIALIIFILFVLEVKATDENLVIKRILQSIQQRYAPDLRTAVFDISYKKSKTGIVLFGEVDTPEAKTALIDALRKNLKVSVIDNIQVLPDTTLGSFRNGIVVIDVGDVRNRPHKQEELTTQVLMGTVVAILKKSEGYYFVQMPDRYLGWIDTASLFPLNQTGINAWNIAEKIIITELKCVVRKAPDSSSIPLCNVVIGCVLKRTAQNNSWTAVELADRQKGFIQDSFVQNLDDWENSRMLTGENLEKTAKTMLGIPYIWGGTSVKGMDCSGFTKIVYRLNGVELYRDSDQQADQGIPVDPGKNFKNLQKGDLLFFGSGKKEKQTKRITHVGLSLGKGLFIHSSISKSVRISSLDSSSVYFEKPLLEMFVLARRIIKTDLHNVIQN